MHNEEKQRDSRELLFWKTFCFQYIHKTENVNGHLIVLAVHFKKQHILLLSVTEKYQLLLKIDRYKDGSYLKHILGG